MTSRLTVDGYTFDNPPSDYRKIIQLSNNPQPFFNRFSSDFYQSDSQDVQFQVSGELSLNESSDLSELETLQKKAINGGEVSVEFDPFFSGKGVIVDNPFTQEDQRGSYDFTFKINKIDTDPTGYPAHATPTTGNTFELGSFNFGFDPDSVEEEYQRQTASVETLQGLNRVVDNKGLVPEVTVSGRTDGAGGQALWDKARTNALSYLSAEFQQGWSLITRLQVGNDPDTPDFVTGLLQYSADFLIVKDPSGGIGNVSSFIDHAVRDTGYYTADPDAGDSDADTVTFSVSSGDTDLSGQPTSFPAATVDVQLDTTNYVYVADPDADGTGEVRVNQSAFPSDAAPLVEVETDDSGVTNTIDRRDTDTSGGDDTLDSIGFTVDAGSDSDAGVSWSKTVLQLDPNATNYVYADGSSGDVSVNTSGFPSGDVDLYEVQTDATSVDVVLDQRAGTTTGGDDTVDTLGYAVDGGTGAINGAYVAWDATTVQLDFGATNYVFVDDPDGDGEGQVVVNQSAVPSDALGLWEAETDGDGVTNETDLRDSLIDDGPGGDSDLSFTTDLQIFDGDIDFARILALGTDTVADPVLTEDYLGKADLSEAVPDPSDADLSATGKASLSETVAVNDGGSATTAGGGTPEQVTWSSGSDWDAAVSEAGVVHEDRFDTPGAGTIRLGYPNFDRGGSALEAFNPLAETSGSTFSDVTGNGYTFDDNGGGNVGGGTGLHNTPAYDTTDDGWAFGNQTPSFLGGSGYTLFIWARVNQDLQNSFTRIINADPGANGGSGERTMWTWDDDDGLGGHFTEHNGNDADGRVAAGDLSVGNWYSLAVVFDGSEVRSYLNGSQIDSDALSATLNTGDLTMTYNQRSDQSSNTGDNGDYILHYGRWYSRGLSDSEVQALHDAGTGGNLTTATKTFSSNTKPDLQNLQYDLKGETVELTVIGSPGEASEETHTVTLDGSSSYSINWSNSHTDFRVTVDISTSDLTTSPTVSQVELEGQTGGSEGDQNPQTNWELQPGQYDTGGNEYEGGGITATYGD
jgi:hypothetical protein